MDSDPYHEGEIAVQARAGQRELAGRHGRLIGDRIMQGALDFVATRPMVVVGSVSPREDVWASVVFGPVGFVGASDRHVAIDLARAIRTHGDPLWSNLERDDAHVGMLFIDLATRRRVRVNGRASLDGPERLNVAVTESFPNCSRFIHRREPGAIASERRGGSGVEVPVGPALGALASRADTLFVATAHATRGVDVSHRGGAPGFVKVRSDGALRVPDYAGNGMFNTLGNLSVDPRAGLLFVDFQRGDLLQLTGRAEIEWDVDDPAGETGGTRRWWTFQPERAIASRGAAPSGWRDLEAPTTREP